MLKSSSTGLSGSATPFSLSEIVRSIFVWFRHASERNSTFDQLNELSDEHLRDIGVDRRDIGSVVERELERLRRSDIVWR
jgi:uncharacterized protein YjiS (DUF1127 family)